MKNKHYDGINDRVIETAAARIREQIKSIGNMFTVPVGQKMMTPGQVRQTYGLSVRQIQDLEKEHGPEVVARMLKLFKGVNNAG